MRRLIALLLIGAAPTSAWAQDPTDVAQIPPTPGMAVPLAPLSGEAGEAAAQLSGDAESIPNQVQLTSASASPEQPPQVASPGRDARPPQPLSTPEQGHTAAIDPVTGHDKCDPAVTNSKTSPECRKVIENRAAEYRRAPVTELSPEQKLLIDQQLRENAAQQLANSGDPTNDNDAMGIAALVLKRNRQPDSPEDKPSDAKSDAAVQAVISVLQGSQPHD